MNSSEAFEKNDFATAEDIVARFPEISQRELDEPVEIKTQIRAIGPGSFADFWGALGEFEKENPDAKGYVAFHQSFGSGFFAKDLQEVRGFDYPDGRIMNFLRAQLESLTAQVKK